MPTLKHEPTGYPSRKSSRSLSAAYNSSLRQIYANTTTPSERPTKNWYALANSLYPPHLILIPNPTRTPNHESLCQASPSATLAAASAPRRWRRTSTISSPLNSSSAAAKTRRNFGASTGSESIIKQDQFLCLSRIRCGLFSRLAHRKPHPHPDSHTPKLKAT